MQVVILAGGFGTRLSEETDLIPKPMVRIGTSTGGRIKKLENILEDEFMLTYGDGLSNVDLELLLDQHKRFGKLATVTAVRPPARFGTIEISNSLVTKFAEKDPQDAGWINGGFFCLNKKVNPRMQAGLMVGFFV